MLIYDPEERITAKAALRHSYFKDLREAEQKGLLETSLQSVKLLKKQYLEKYNFSDESSIHEDEQNTSHILKKTLYS